MRLSAKQIIASVTGAVLAALALSFLGVTGTIVGVALGSAAATVGSAFVFQSLEQGHAKVKEVIGKPGQGFGFHPPPPPPPPPMGIGPSAWEATPTHRPAPPLPPPLYAQSRDPGRRWSIFATVALVFALSLGLVTLIELAAGESLSSALGQHGSSASTSIGGLFAPGTSTTTTTTTTTTTRPTTTTTSTPASSTTTSSTTTTTTGPTSTTSTTTAP
jgi:hypothetical protein